LVPSGRVGPAGEHVEFAAEANIPDAGRAVGGARDEPPAIRAEEQGFDAARMPEEATEFLLLADAPQAGRAVE
jgi:hypothetical protein